MDKRTIRRRLREERKRLEALLLEREESVVANGDPGDPGPTELSFVDQHAADAGSELFERQKELSLRENAEGRLQDVDDALRKLDEGTYGDCEVCGDPIPKARLEAVPTARLCVDDQRAAEREAAAS
jgi:DnaK suppressor protein